MRIELKNMINGKHNFLICFTPSISWSRSYEYETGNIMFTWLGFAVVFIIKE